MNITDLRNKIDNDKVDIKDIFSDSVNMAKKYQDEYNEAIDFINKYKYDIIEKVLS